MFNYISDQDIDRFIEEDAPYGDLTTHLLGIGDLEGEIVFTTRDETTLCCTEEASRLLERLGAKITMSLPSGTLAGPGTDFLRAGGKAEALHTGWKAALNILEYASGIATRTARIVKAARTVNSRVMVATTRKSFPGTKKISIKAIIAGGALPHRLGLSETMLVFRQHTAFTGGLDGFLSKIGDIRLNAAETIIEAEAHDAGEAERIALAGADIVQVDKMKSSELAELVKKIREIAPGVKISAAGGVNESNAVEYAGTGVDIIVLSSVYFGKPADIAARIDKK